MRTAHQLAALIGLATLGIAELAHGDPDRLLGDDTFAVSSEGGLRLDADLRVARPAALTTGLSSGFELGVTRECGCWWSYGARASYTVASESSLAWDVSQSDYRLRATAGVHHRAGRGTIALQLAVGPTLVHEVRVRTQSQLAGNLMETRALTEVAL